MFTNWMCISSTKNSTTWILGTWFSLVESMVAKNPKMTLVTILSLSKPRIWHKTMTSDSTLGLKIETGHDKD